ncbi:MULTISPECIES: SDR family oxidoreductase [unclassified Frigoribacterium]|uniref:SDR family oxidoreductase n=1 Tax=unclassified Frigoribacterium TaxID=2627005 RepID=UPI0006F5ECA6|nr:MULTISPECIES: SDR family oxidoreductase [unclassified Frigoribacterium]KQO46229.1 3-beta hydroxysteroid dehydrogenase [Frigoribacterium sp. Leaf254]KQT38321.1 3-beta hydroxysteroid dehydrogenase [Frigoribacterium sp. Leaf415]
MNVFVTGASGWIGSAVVDELLAAGHRVTGLARSDASAASLEAKGASVRRGDLDDLGAVRAGATDADAVLHLANKHDWSDMAASNRAERGAVEALVAVVEGSGRPLLLASGTAGLAQGRLATEADRTPFRGPDAPRGGSENLALDAAERGVHTVSVRFGPTVHGAGDHGFVASLVAVAREKGVSAYPGDGSNRWPAVHRSDAARAVALGLEKAAAGDVLHVVAEEGVSTRAIAGAIGRAYGLPVESVPTERVTEHFGWIGGFFGLDLAASSEATRRLLGWTPTGPTLLEDLDAGAYGSGR